MYVVRAAWKGIKRPSKLAGVQGSNAAPNARVSYAKKQANENHLFLGKGESTMMGARENTRRLFLAYTTYNVPPFRGLLRALADLTQMDGHLAEQNEYQNQVSIYKHEKTQG